MPVRLKYLPSLIAILLTLSSCMVVTVGKNEKEAEAIVIRAREKALKTSLNSSTIRKPHRLKMLIYDPDDGQLLRISLPLWLIRKGLGQEIRDAVREGGPDLEFDVRGFCRALLEMPRGLLAEVLTDREKVLLWLE